jgi:SAM-dependent methyltransferase
VSNRGGHLTAPVPSHSADTGQHLLNPEQNFSRGNEKTANPSAIARDWDEHWSSLESGRAAFSLASKAMRKFIFQPAVAHYCDRFFPKSGIFIEMGCGTAYSSLRLPRHGRTLIGLDFSAVALRKARADANLNGVIQADMLAVPCRCDSVDGIWNLGVMEHFTESEIRLCLREFRRVLKPGGGVTILFWPTKQNFSRWILGPIERLLSRSRGSNFTFFPDEISRIESKHQALELMQSEGFSVKKIHFGWRTAFIHMVIVATNGDF